MPREQGFDTRLRRVDARRFLLVACVAYVTSREGMNNTRSSDAFVYDVETGQYWNILDDIERLPKLDGDIAQKSYRK